jgi:hypothetical protein
MRRIECRRETFMLGTIEFFLLLRSMPVSSSSADAVPEALSASQEERTFASPHGDDRAGVRSRHPSTNNLNGPDRAMPLALKRRVMKRIQCPRI